MSDFYDEIVRKARQRAGGAPGARQTAAQARRERWLVQARERAWQQSQERLVAAQQARAERREQALAVFWPDDDGLDD